MRAILERITEAQNAHDAPGFASYFAEDYRRGVIIVTVRDDQIAAGRLCMEPVELGGDDIDDAVAELYRQADDEA